MRAYYGRLYFVSAYDVKDIDVTIACGSYPGQCTWYTVYPCLKISRPHVFEYVVFHYLVCCCHFHYFCLFGAILLKSWTLKITQGLNAEFCLYSFELESTIPILCMWSTVIIVFTHGTKVCWPLSIPGILHGSRLIIEQCLSPRFCGWLSTVLTAPPPSSQCFSTVM